MEKCGEIMLTNKTKFIFICAFCNEEFKEMLSFGKHVHQDHLKLDNNEFEDIKEKTTNSSLDSSKLGKETQSGSIISTLSQDQDLQSVKEKSDSKSVETLKELNHVTVKELYLPTIPEPQNNTDSDELILTILEDKHAEGPHKVFQCPELVSSEKNQTFHTPSNYEDDNSKILENDIFKCDDCDREFRTESQLVHHTRIHTGRKNHICPHCSKRYKVKHGLVRHIRTHTGERPFKCTHCSKAFNDKPGLDMHIRRHLGEKRHACNICDKRFVQKAEVRIHMRSHTGEKPYQCDECGTNFATSSALAAHKRRHSNARNYKCEICNKKFRFKTDLKEHSVVHSKERPFQCEICLVTYPRKGTLKDHMKIHSNVKDYVCKICGKAFAQNSGLYCHMKSHGIKLGQTKRPE